MEQKPSIDVDWVQLLAGALAATSSAVLLSTVGVAGTIIGAAAGSIVATIGGAVYAYYLAASRERVFAARELLASGSAAERARVKRELNQAEEALPEGDGQAGRPTTWRKILARVGWKHIALASIGMFVVVMTVILVFELMAGRPVSSYTGGTDNEGPRTTIPLGRGKDARDKPTRVPSPSSDTSSATSTSSPSVSEGTTGPATPSTSPSTPGASSSAPTTTAEPGTPSATTPTGPTGTPSP